MSAVATDRMRLAWETTDRLRSTRLAAQELAISVSSLCSMVKDYCDRTGEPYPRGMVQRARLNGTTPALRLTERLDVIEAQLDDILTAENARDKTLYELVALVRELNGRSPILLLERYASHQRKADGGVGGKAERSGG